MAAPSSLFCFGTAQGTFSFGLDGSMHGLIGGGSGGNPDRLDPTQAAKLLVLMEHARGCSGSHADAQHAQVCRSTKFLMLHIRDCDGLAPALSGNDTETREAGV